MFAISAPTEIVDALIAAKANVDDVDEWGQTALMFASHTKFLNTIERLLVAGASVDIKDRIEGKTALLHAANESLIATSGVVQKLITAGANVNEVDARGQTALMLAASTGAWDSVLILLKAGAKLNVKDIDGKTPLMFAVWPSKDSTPDIVRTLIKAGARVNDVDMKGESALMIAAKYASTDILQVLVAARAKLDATNNQGQTALMVAIQSSRPWKLENVRFLLKSGANVNIKDNENITALELAKKLGESEIVTLLEQAQTRR
jgi:ankyrin repeat protein